MTEKIFISYAQEDREIAETVETRLREHGVVTTPNVEFLDPQKHAQTGDDMRKTIKRAISAASKFVVIDSPYSERSQWVNYEVGMASALGKPIVSIGNRSSHDSTLLQAVGDVQAIAIDDVV